MVMILLLSINGSCKEPFEAKVKFYDSGFLVVEGYIDVGQDAVTFITLGRTTPINEEAYFLAEQGAIVSIEDEDNNSYSLTEITSGHYESDVLNLPQEKLYRLKILSHEKTYVSEFTKPIITPELDSISWKELPEGIHIYATTHDPENKTIYYQWNYSEVWERTVPYYSFCKYSGNQFIPRSASEIREMKNCWVYDAGADINVASSEKYPTDIIPLNPIKFIPHFDERVNIRYSISVSQHALTKRAYNFYEILKKNGDLGTFSDPMPTELPTNLYCLTSSEAIVGVIEAYTTQSKRLEIHESQLEPGWVVPPTCYELERAFTAQEFSVIKNSFLPTMCFGDNSGIGAAMVAPIKSVNCLINGGSIQRPSFWN